MFDQEHDETGVLGRQFMLATETARIPCAERAVITAAALCDVMEQRSDVEQPRAFEVRDQLAAERILVCMFCEREAPQVAQHLQDVLIHGVDMEQVVLHLPDDASEHRQVAPQDRQLVHPSQFVQHALRLLQYLEEGRAIARVAPITRIDAYTRMPQRTHQRRGHAAQFAMLRHQQKGTEDSVRIRIERVRCAQIEQLAANDEGLIERLRCRIVPVKQAQLDVLQHDRVHLGDRLGRPVVALHHHFARAACRGRMEAGALRDRVLHIEYEAVLAPIGDEMQPGANLLQTALAAADQAGFLGGDQSAPRQLRPGLAVAKRTCDP